MNTNTPWVARIVYGIGSIFFALVSTIIAWSSSADDITTLLMIPFGVVVWVIIFVTWGLRIVDENTFIVVERFGAYYYTRITPGIVILCLPGLIDRIAPEGGRGDFKYHRINLYADEPDNLIDFIDGSAAIGAQIWYRVNPAPDLSSDEKDGPYRWVYRVENTPNRIEEILDGVLRPILQNESIDSAQKNLGNISITIRKDPEIKKSLDELGVVLDPVKGFLITDIELDEETINIRRQALEGLKEAQKTAAKGKGFADSIRAIMRASEEDGGQPISFKEAREIFERQTALQTVRETGANVTLVASDIKGVNILLGIGEKERR